MTQTKAKSEGRINKTDEAKSRVICFLTVSPDLDKSIPTYWVKFDPQISDEVDLKEALKEILVDPSFQTGKIEDNDKRHMWREEFQKSYIYWAEKQFLPGVTDNLSKTIEEALRLKGISSTVEVASGATYLITSSDLNGWNIKSEENIEEFAAYNWYHPLTERFRVHSLKGDVENLLTFPQVSLKEPVKPQTINLEISDNALNALSKDRLLALSLEEMKAMKKHYQSKKSEKLRLEKGMDKNPTDIEVEVIAQTWSEHCKHKIFNARINFVELEGSSNTPHHQIVDSLYKTYIKGATKKLKPIRPDLLSVFEDNSGIVKWNDSYGVCFKVETHNSPSALEPYGGALTGILGVNRDILGTGLGARPIFNTDIFCFASPDSKELARRPKLLPPETIPKGVRKGVEDGGNKSGIPTVNGAIYFHDGYRAKPLVFCGTGGILPLEKHGLDHVFKHTKPGDSILVVGGRVGKDGIHGATFSSESLNEGSPVSAVQIGDPFTQKRVIDYVLAAQEKGLISGITDNGAGGLSSSVGEMASITGGAKIDLNKVPLKYPGLLDWEIVISESQERMTLSSSKVDELLELAEHFDVEVSKIGEFTDHGYFEVVRGNKILALLDLEFLHDGLPRLELDAKWKAIPLVESEVTDKSSLADKLKTLLSHPNISSREDVIRQYDHEVQGQSVIKPLMGTYQQAPSDAAVILPLLDDKKGLVVSNGICPQWSRYDPYIMAQMAVDEAIRNGVCVGASPKSFSLLDNFCWPDPVVSDKNKDGDYKLGQLVRTCQGLYDACLAYKAPLISGKDSMKNDFDDGVVRLSIPPTLLVSAIAMVEDISFCLSSDFKRDTDLIYLVSVGVQSLTGSHLHETHGISDGTIPNLDLERSPKMYDILAANIRAGNLNSAHDLSEGGLAVCLAESIIGSKFGASVDLRELMEILKKQKSSMKESADFAMFAEGPSRILVTVPHSKKSEWLSSWSKSSAIDIAELGQVTKERKLEVKLASETIIDVSGQILEDAWKVKLPME